MARLELQGVRRTFGPATVIQGVDLQVADGEFCVFVGPSGCGKSTLLRLIAGLEECSAGRVLIDGRDVTQAQPARRGIAMVFQSYALYPHMTVAENMGFGLSRAKVPQYKIDAAVGRAAQTLQIDHLLQRRPKDLSGGQRQRVAIGRAIVRDPQLFLFDEPLSNLDAALRVEMRVELSKIKAKLGTTFVYVTHDQTEAMTLADKIVVLRDGRVEQVGAPLELYERPANRFVAGFIGSPRMNFFDARSVEPWARAPSGLTLGVRPEHIRLVDPFRAHLLGRVVMTERLGGETFIHADTPGGTALVKVDGDSALRVGDGIGLSVPRDRAHFFAADGARLAVPDYRQSRETLESTV